ncbi:MAG: nitric oxide reductase activation protein [Gammaproteobacteria bacterium]|nr:nitric oxide reductase activation protein [Gammaproteobacteria bacterium]
MSEEARQNLFNRVRIQKDLERRTSGALSRHADLDGLVARIAALEPDQQAFVYQWCERICTANNELAAHFVSHAPAAFARMDRAGVESWIDGAMQTYDHRGLGFAIEALEGVAEFAADHAGRHARCHFEDAAAQLRPFIRGLGGRELRIAAGRETFTDTETLFLPDTLSRFALAEDNLTLYKLTAVHLWAQTCFGTWRYHVVERLVRDYQDDAAIAIFNRLECLRLDAAIAREFPGAGREMAALALPADDAAARALWNDWQSAAAELLSPDATALDSLARIASFQDQPLPPPRHYQGAMFIGNVRQVMFARAAREKAALQRALAELTAPAPLPEGGGAVPEHQRVELQAAVEGGGAEPPAGVEISFNGEALPLPEDLNELLGSVLQDFGEIPDEHLRPPTIGAFPDQLAPGAGSGSAETAGEGGVVFEYREWDCVRQRYRDAFCALRELDVPPGDAAFVTATREKYHGLLKSIRKTFEAVVAETRVHRRQRDGDDIDIDAVVQAFSDVACGREMSEYLYTRYRNSERSIAVMFMVDMSGSTDGWVNEAEREALVLLCEALEMLGDRYAIFGFSGRTNRRCEVYRIKDFDEPYDIDVRRRISGITPKAYTRMGAAIRHLGRLLDRTHARTRLLITLSDGRPEDYGGYKGKYGIEDTRHALLEIRQSGIHPFCITIDTDAQEYLPHMYGAANYAVIDQVSKLPYKVADIYRRLTT